MEISELDVFQVIYTLISNNSTFSIDCSLRRENTFHNENQRLPWSDRGNIERDC